jgi:hypothetical protein
MNNLEQNNVHMQELSQVVCGKIFFIHHDGYKISEVLIYDSL